MLHTQHALDAKTPFYIGIQNLLALLGPLSWGVSFRIKKRFYLCFHTIFCIHTWTKSHKESSATVFWATEIIFFKNNLVIICRILAFWMYIFQPRWHKTAPDPTHTQFTAELNFVMYPFKGSMSETRFRHFCKMAFFAALRVRLTWFLYQPITLIVLKMGSIIGLLTGLLICLLDILAENLFSSLIWIVPQMLQI